MKKTATAVILALFGAANAADVAAPADATALTTFGDFYKFKCHAAAEGAALTDGVTDAYTCFTAALAKTQEAGNEAKEYCVQYADAACTMHVGYALACDELAAGTSVYQKNGKYQDDGPTPDASCSAGGGGGGGGGGQTGTVEPMAARTCDHVECTDGATPEDVTAPNK